eukprot:7030555-Pyramimonas_sp.AAC.2
MCIRDSPVGGGAVNPLSKASAFVPPAFVGSRRFMELQARGDLELPVLGASSEGPKSFSLKKTRGEDRFWLRGIPQDRGRVFVAQPRAKPPGRAKRTGPSGPSSSSASNLGPSS